MRRRAVVEALRGARQTPFYAEKFRTISGEVRPEGLDELPFTTRDELLGDQSNVPAFGAFHAIGVGEAALIGRSGVGFSASGRRLNLLAGTLDIRRQAALFARVLFEAGVRPGHRVYIADDPRYNLLAMYAMHAVSVIGGIIVYTAAERSARTAHYVVPAIPPDHVFLTPTYASYFAKVLAERSGGRWPVRSLSGWGEPGYSEAHVRDRLQELWHPIVQDSPMAIVDAYGLSETGLIAMGCREGRGLHVLDDACLVELVDPDGERVLDSGATGEIVVTRLGGTAAPLVRYRTGDVARLDAEPCRCGRVAPRLTRVQRLCERVVVRGRPIFPLDVEEALVRAGTRFTWVVLWRDDTRLRVHLDGGDRVRGSVELSRRLERELGVPVEVDGEALQPPPPFLHKAMRVIDDQSIAAYRTELEYQRELEHV